MTVVRPETKIASIVTAALFVGLAVSSFAVAQDDPDVDTSGQWTGFISCSVSFTTAQTPAPCPGSVDANRDDVHEFEADSGLMTIVVAMEWDPATTSTEDNLRNWLFEDQGGEWQSLSRERGPSPIEYRLDFDEPSEEPGDFQFRVYAGCCAVVPLNVGVVFQQPFTVHWHLFYGEPAPEDYSALP